MGDQAHNGRRAGALRWGDEERRLLSRLLDLFSRDPDDVEAFDPTRATDVAYLRAHHERHQFFNRHPAKNFYQNARRASREWLSNQAAEGTRRRESRVLFSLVFRLELTFLLIPHTQKKPTRLKLKLSTNKTIPTVLTILTILTILTTAQTQSSSTRTIKKTKKQLSQRGIQPGERDLLKGFY
jgi:hypothetical protein